MAGFLHGKMKRKGSEEVCDGLTDFWCPSPATKIRRLDPELSSTMEDFQLASNSAFIQPLQGYSDLNVSGPSEFGLPNEAISSSQLNEERAIVLYKPVEAQAPLTLYRDPTSVLFRVSSDLIHGFKNHVLRPGNTGFDTREEGEGVDPSSLAVVPWVPIPSVPSSSGVDSFKSGSNCLQEPMEAEEIDAASMEVEEEATGQATAFGAGGQAFQMPQHCCMIPPPLASTSSPLMWLR